jgi:aspartyl-tRNA(Asn)/glutamyl-tRNA(Gln) amidotransferase subunit C
MITKGEVEKLAKLSRLKLSDSEVAKMQTDMEAILAYVDKLKMATSKETGPVMSVNKNVMREDLNAHAGGEFTEKLIGLAPRKETTKDGKFIKVKKIIGGSQ